MATFLADNNKNNILDTELYEYAIRLLVQGIINIVFIIFIGFIFDMVKECLMLTFTFFVLRKFTGGFHAQRFVTCLLSSNIVIIVGLLLIRMVVVKDLDILLLICTAISLMLIFKFSPVEQKNKILNRREKKTHKIISVILSTLLAIIAFCLIHNKYILGYSICVGILAVGILIFFSIIMHYRCDSDVKNNFS